MFSIQWRPPAMREFLALALPDRKRIGAAIEPLAANPRLQGAFNCTPKRISGGYGSVVTGSSTPFRIRYR